MPEIESIGVLQIVKLNGEFKFSMALCPGHQMAYESVSKSFRTGRLKRELQMVELFATRCSCIAVL